MCSEHMHQPAVEQNPLTQSPFYHKMLSVSWNWYWEWQREWLCRFRVAVSISIVYPHGCAADGEPHDVTEEEVRCRTSPGKDHSSKPEVHCTECVWFFAHFCIIVKSKNYKLNHHNWKTVYIYMHTDYSKYEGNSRSLHCLTLRNLTSLVRPENLSFTTTKDNFPRFYVANSTAIFMMVYHLQ